MELLRLEKRSLQVNLLVIFLYLKENWKKDGVGLFTRIYCDRTWVSGLKLKVDLLQIK